MPLILHFDVALAALLIEAVVSYPPSLYRKIGHPVTWFGHILSFFDDRFNQPALSPAQRRIRGTMTIALLVVSAMAMTLALSSWLQPTWFGRPILGLLASSLLAQRSIYTHVKDVSLALRTGGLAAGRHQVSRIVGRDVAGLDEAGVARAAIESLAENFSDGVVAPLLWLVILGLPGIVAYKIINTADSMIGHRTVRHLDFGWTAARLDDAVNYFPARIAALDYVVLAWLRFGRARARSALHIIWRDAPRHRSPNGGWPEAAMAGALRFQLNGPRLYHGKIADEPVTGDGNYDLKAPDIDRALDFYIDGCVMLGACLAGMAFLSG